MRLDTVDGMLDGAVGGGNVLTGYKVDVFVYIHEYIHE